MADIFLSYSREDLTKAKRLEAALEAQGWSVFRDENTLLAGQDIDVHIEAAITAAKCVVVGWSKAAKSSTWVKGEARLGLKQKKLLPILFEEVEPPLDFGALQTENFVDWQGDQNHEEFKKLVRAIISFVGPGKASAPSSDEPEAIAVKAQGVAGNQPEPPKAVDISPTTKKHRQYTVLIVIFVVLFVGAMALNYKLIAPNQTSAAASPELKVSKDCGYCPEMVKLPTGILMGKYEVTQAQWQAVMGYNPSFSKACGDNCPVEFVTWHGVNTYLDKLNDQTKQHYRLPSEEEWLSACQAGNDEYEYCGSNDLDAVAWWKGNSNHTTHPLGKKNPNAWGLYDMSGNVWEWTSSCWENDCARRVLRGGSWGGKLDWLRSASRDGYFPFYRDGDIGFRLAQN